MSKYHTLSRLLPSIVLNRSNDLYREASDIRFNKDVDIHGRTRHLVEGNEICNNFNGDKGCFRANCLRAHICLNCHKAHSQINCYLNKDSSTPNLARSQPKKLETPPQSTPEELDLDTPKVSTPIDTVILKQHL